jgi:hypothetical protein
MTSIARTQTLPNPPLEPITDMVFNWIPANDGSAA